MTSADPAAANDEVPPPKDRATLHLTIALQKTLEQAESQPLCLGLIIETTQERAFGVLMAFLCIPFMQPIPLPGLSIPFGISLALLGLQVAIGWHKPWLPRRMLGWKLPPRSTAMFLRAVAKIFRPLEKIIHPRLCFMQNRGAYFVVGLALTIDGLLLTVLPAFPGSNIIPAWIAIFKILGLTEEDGVLMLIGIFLSAIACAACVLVAMLGVDGVLIWWNGAAASQPATATSPMTMPQ